MVKMPSNDTQLSTEGHLPTFSEISGPGARYSQSAQSIIDELRTLPPFDPTVGMKICDLAQVVSRISPPNPAAQKLSHAVESTFQLWHGLEGFGGQKHISLLDFGSRLNYFERALEAAMTSSPPPPDTQGLFEADQYGTPLTWHTHHHENQERLHRGYHNYALYKFAALIERWASSSHGLSAGMFDHDCYDALCDMLASGVEYDHPVIGYSEWEQRTALARKLIVEGNPEQGISRMKEFLTARVLAHIPEELRTPELFQRLALRCYSNTTPPSEEIWRSITAINDTWSEQRERNSVRHEGYRHSFERSELEACVTTHNGTLLTLNFDDKIAYFALSYSDPARIPAVTRQKIDAAVDSGFITSQKLDSWVFLVARNPLVSNSLHRAARHDWYTTFMDAIGDVAIGNGAERIIGRVLDSNTSKYSHARAGAQSAHTQVTDASGDTSEILTIEYL